MKRFLVGFLLGVLVATSAVALADNTVRLFVNGKEIAFPDAPPQMINNRVMVPARPLAEALGAMVDWEPGERKVIVTSVTTSTTSAKSATLKVNGKDTGYKFWLDENGEPMVLSGVFCMYMLDVLYPAGGSFVPTLGRFYPGEQRTEYIEIRVESKDQSRYVSMADAQAKGIVRYTWDSDTNNLTVTR
jgi:hypothetical protein